MEREKDWGQGFPRCSLAQPPLSVTCGAFVVFSLRQRSRWLLRDAYIVRKWTSNLRTKSRKCVHQRKEIEKRMPHFESTCTTEFIKQFSRIKFPSQTMRAFLSHTLVCSVIICVTFYLRRVETESRFFLRTLYASLP